MHFVWLLFSLVPFNLDQFPGLLYCFPSQGLFRVQASCFTECPPLLVRIPDRWCFIFHIVLHQEAHNVSFSHFGEAQCAHLLLLLPYSLLRTSHFTLHVNTFSHFPQPSYWSPYYLASYSKSPTNESNLLFQSHGALSWHMLYVIAKLNCLWLSTDLHTCVKKLSETLGKNQQNKYNNPLSLDTVSRKRRRRRGQKKLAEEINNG